MSEQPAFEWGVLTESWWRENGAACRASELQIRFACARHLGANKAKSAALAGYSGGPEALRSAGVRAEGTKAVEDLLTLAAAAESPGDADTATATEIDRKLTKPEEFERFAGRLARISTIEPVENQKFFEGRLAGVAGGKVQIEVQGRVIAVPMEGIRKANLVVEF